MYEMNGRVSYCIDLGVDITTSIYHSTNDFSISYLSNDQIEYISSISYFGYKYDGHDDSESYRPGGHFRVVLLRGQQRLVLLSRLELPVGVFRQLRLFVFHISMLCGFPYKRKCKCKKKILNFVFLPSLAGR